MAKKRLLLVVGAGASVEFGMSSAAAVRGIINNAIQTRYPLLRSPATNLYEYIEGSLPKTHRDRARNRRLKKVPITVRREIR